MKKCGCNNNNNNNSSAGSSKSTKSCHKQNNDDCCNTCDIGKFVYVMLGTFLGNGGSGVSGDYPQVWDVNGIAQTTSNDLVLNETYYVVFSEPDIINAPPASSWQDDAYAFVWSEQLNMTIFGNPESTNALAEYVALVGYINDRINELCLPCCVKEKIVSAITAYVNNQLSPLDGDALNGGNFNQTLLQNQQFTTFCDDDIVPKCGPIYVANIIRNGRLVALGGGAGVGSGNSQTNVNYIMQFLNMVQFYLRSYYSTKCCCDESHVSECKCKPTYADVCQYVFGRICVIDVKINNPNILT